MSTVAIALLVGMLCDAAPAAVEVQTNDGRQLAGLVDSRTDDVRLWLRHEEEGIVLTTGLSWDSLREVFIDGQQVTPDQLRGQVQELASRQPEGYLMECGPPVFTIQEQHPHHGIGRITNLVIDAQLVNLDRTVEPDGYEIMIAAIDEFGQQVPVRGNLYVRLQGERDIHHTGRIHFEDLQRWSQSISPHDFQDGYAVYAVKFRDFDPELDDQLRPEGQLNVRLGVFGQGNYSATLPVALWNYSTYRDRLQMFEGSRFFVNEVSHRTRQQNTDPPGIYREGW